MTKTLSDYWTYLTTAVVVFFGALYLYKKHKERIKSLEDALIASRAKTEIRRLKAIRDEKSKVDKVQKRALKELDIKIAKAKRDAVEHFTDIKGYSDQAVSRAYDRLGF